MKELVVTVAVAAVCESEKEGAVLADELLCGSSAELLRRCTGGILRIRSSHGYEGYAKGDSFTQQEDSWKNAPKLIVTGSYVNVQDQPSVRSVVIISLPRGSLCCGEGPSVEGWQSVCLAGGQRGFIQTVHLETYPMGAGLGGEALRRSLCRSVLSYMGCCYRWGGKTPLGIDCSGLCSQVYLNHGIAIYRDARIVEGYPVREIHEEKLAPADLLYFRGHMAFWLGGGRYIHSAASSGGVTVNSLVKGEPDYREDLAKGLIACGSVFSEE